MKTPTATVVRRKRTPPLTMPAMVPGDRLGCGEVTWSSGAGGLGLGFSPRPPPLPPPLLELPFEPVVSVDVG